MCRRIIFFLLVFLVAGCNPSPVTPTITQAATPFFTLTPIAAESTSAPTVSATATPTAGPRDLILIFDDDGSRDGMAALLYLLTDPLVTIKAVTVSYGEAHPERYIHKVGSALESVGIADIPLGAGQDESLGGGVPFPNWLRDLSNQFWKYPLSNGNKTFSVQDAPELLVSIINQSAEPVTLFVSGPFTNLAQALELDPEIKNNISAVYFMGGSVYAPGNITNLLPDSDNRVAEWNILADPEAAKIVFASGLKLIMIPLDATNKVILTREEISPWLEGDAKAKMAADLYNILFDGGFEKVEIFDLTAAVIMAHPELCDLRLLPLEVVTEEGPKLGQTKVVTNSTPNVLVCLDPEVDQLKQTLEESFSP